MCMETGNLPGSTEALSEALEIARVLRDPAWKRRFGTTLDWPSKEPLSTETLFSVLSGLRQEASASTTSFAEVEKQAYANMASCALHLHDVRTGIKSVRKAIALNPNPTQADDCFVRVIAESQYARLLLEIGEMGMQRNTVERRESLQTRPRPRARTT